MNTILALLAVVSAHAAPVKSMDCAIEKINASGPNEPILTFNIAMGEQKSHFVGGLDRFDVTMAITPASRTVPATIIATFGHSAEGQSPQQATVTVSAKSDFLAIDLGKSMQLMCVRAPKSTAR